MGDKRPRIQKVACRRLNSKVKRIKQEYIDRLEEQMRRHKVIGRIQRLQEEADGEFGETSRKTLNRLDQEITEMMLGAEKKCHKLYQGAYEFSPEVKSWIEKGRAIQGLLRYIQTNWNGERKQCQERSEEGRPTGPKHDKQQQLCRNGTRVQEEMQINTSGTAVIAPIIPGSSAASGRRG